MLQRISSLKLIHSLLISSGIYDNRLGFICLGLEIRFFKYVSHDTDIITVFSCSFLL